MSCLTLRTKSPPDSSSSSTTLGEATRPDAQAWAMAANVGSGCAGHGQSGLLLGLAQLAGQRLDGLPPLAHVGGTGTTAPAAAPGCGARR